MSMSCGWERIPIGRLAPKFVEFTKTVGVLRCLKPGEEISNNDRPQGLMFLCPKCKDDKEKQHFNIFLFPNAPEAARPLGRFIPLKDAKGKLIPLLGQSLDPIETLELHPADVPCRWRGHLEGGIVSWRPGILN